MQEMIVDAAEQAAEVCRRLLAVARRQPLDPEPLALGPWAAGLQRLLQRTLGEHVDVRIPQAPALRNALVDRAELERAVLNLAVNARDAMPSGGTLWLEVGPARASDVEVGEDAQDYLTLTIRDTGAGIDEATRARLFEPFFSTKPAGKGTGLGLAQVHGFVRQSGGLVHVDSAPGAGTSVRLVLPTTELEPTERPGRTPVPAESRAGSVLLVEDEGTVRLFVETVLQRAGYTVLAVDRGADARRLLEGDRSFDLLVTDVVLPDDGGPALLAEARRLRPGLPALMISGYAEFGDGGRLPARLLRKPFDARRLCEEVDRVLSRSAVRSA
jgi:CheY-like chemotaxis protein